MSEARPYNRVLSPALERLASVARALGDLCDRVVFIGGAILPLLEHDSNVLGAHRSTKDVDGVVAAAKYVEKCKIEERMRALGFHHDMQPPAHMDRWIAPDKTIFDLVASGKYAGATGSEQDAFAIDTATAVILPPVVRHASPVAFLALKCGAFRDRGSKAPLESKDLSDIAALLATRPGIVEEFYDAPTAVRNFIRDQVKSIITDAVAASSIASHIEDRQPLDAAVADRVLTALRLIGQG